MILVWQTTLIIKMHGQTKQTIDINDLNIQLDKIFFLLCAQSF